MTIDDIALIQIFEATYKGERHTFVKAEHVNIGDGWLCREIAGKLRPGVYSSTEMSDFSIPPTSHVDHYERSSSPIRTSSLGEIGDKP